jgi:hypothetical protein
MDDCDSTTELVSVDIPIDNSPYIHANATNSRAVDAMTILPMT